MPIIIVGGGPAGAVAAITLASRGQDVTVLEADLEPARKVGECLTPGANEMLRALGLLDGMESAGHLPSLGNRAFWGQDAPIERDFLFGTKGGGWHLDRQRFETDLTEIARDAGVSWHSGCRLRSIYREPTRWQLVTEAAEGKTIELAADFIIDATGRARALARKLQSATLHTALLPSGDPDRLMGIAATFVAPDAPISCSPTNPTSPQLRDRFTVVEATETGWWYSALLRDGRLVVVFMTDADLQPKGDPWHTHLGLATQTQRRLQQHGGQLESASPPRSASGSRLAQATGASWLAVGDAALAFDPLSSYGITSAMGTAYYAAHAAADTLAGTPNALPVYQALLDQTWERYLQEHAEHYAREQRWPEAPFWSRRIGRKRDVTPPKLTPPENEHSR